MVISNRLKLYI
ncbi:hypothetical protein NQ315_013547 [Exocentrus adspersus]|uniref:Uncharacterized protein n=1 Tax=Exocentrus adspersus TaxID=1586481 RepID=A0AAV8V6G6_9CUCU|nr:hypothetical protein NQ315_013547 [Exocentrus adspersus]